MLFKTAISFCFKNFKTSYVFLTDIESFKLSFFNIIKYCQYLLFLVFQKKLNKKHIPFIIYISLICFRHNAYIFYVTYWPSKHSMKKSLAYIVLLRKKVREKNLTRHAWTWWSDSLESSGVEEIKLFYPSGNKLECLFPASLSCGTTL